MQGIGDKRVHIVEPEMHQHDLLHSYIAIANGFQCPRQRVRQTNFVVTIGTQQNHAAQVRIDTQMLQQLESCRVQPLQIVEEQCQWVLLPGESMRKRRNTNLKSFCVSCGRRSGTGGCFPIRASTHVPGAQRSRSNTPCAIKFRLSSLLKL
jgi:hypothetical protein